MIVSYSQVIIIVISLSLDIPI